jgi:outer membrane protein assembly factor BamB
MMRRVLFSCFFLLLLLLAGAVSAAGPDSAVLWKTNLGSSTIGGVSMTSDGSYIAASSSAGSFYLLNNIGGELWYYVATDLWGYSRTATIAIHPLGTTILGGAGTKVYAFDREKNIQWVTDTGVNVYGVAISTNGYGYSTAKNVLHFFNTDSSDLFSVNTAIPVWKVAMARDGGFVGAGTSTDHHVYLYDRTGDQRWGFDTGSPVGDIEIAYNGTFLVTGAGRAAFLLDNDGYLLWRYDAASTVNGVSINRDATIIGVGLQDGSVVVLNRQGETLWTGHLDDPVYDIASDSSGIRFAVAAGNSVSLLAPALNVPPPVQPTAPVPVTAGQVSVSSDPPGANVYVDNAYRGITPVVFTDLTTGTHTILLKMNGYQDWSSSIDASSGAAVALKGMLVPLPAASPTKSGMPDAGFFGAAIGLALAALLGRSR